MKRNMQTIIWGVALILIGIIIILNMANVIQVSLWSYIFGLVLIFAGISSIINSKKNYTNNFWQLLTWRLYHHQPTMF